MAAASPGPVQPRMLQEAVIVGRLQEKFKEATEALDQLEEERDRALLEAQALEESCLRMQGERRALLRQLQDLEEACSASTAGRQGRDEQISVLAVQNRSLLQALEHEEASCKEAEETFQALAREHGTLEDSSQSGTASSGSFKQLLASALAEMAKQEEALRSSREETLQLQETEERLLQQAGADMAPLEEKLRLAKQKNIELMRQMQHMEVQESKVERANSVLRATLAELTFKKQDLQASSKGGPRPFGTVLQRETAFEQRKELLEETIDILTQSLHSAEEQLEIARGGSQGGPHSLGHLDDKVGALTEQLHQSQEKLQRKEEAGLRKRAKLDTLEVQSRRLQREYQLLVDQRLEAEAEARTVGHTQAMLQNKNRILEESLKLALTLQEQAENRLREAKEREVTLLVDNDYLAKRIDGNTDDRAAMRYELKRLEDEEHQTVKKNARMVEDLKRLKDKLGHIQADKAELAAEIEFIRGEDMLDESGRTKPIILESESSLMEKLEINEFLLSAQAKRNPVPLLVEKISEILDLLHRAQAEADKFHEYVQDSHMRQTKLRHKNMLLDEKVELCEAWKRRALQKIVSNEFESRQSTEGHSETRDGHVLYLDGLEYNNKDLEELCSVIRKYGKQDEVKEISLQENLLDGSSAPVLCELLDLCPYLRRLDLRQNALDEACVHQLAAYIERIPGVYSCSHDIETGDITATSGTQVRLIVNLEDRHVPGACTSDRPSELTMRPSLAESDEFEEQEEEEDEEEEAEEAEEEEGDAEAGETGLASVEPGVEAPVVGLGGRCSLAVPDAAGALAASARGGAGLAQRLRKLHDLGPLPSGLASPSSASTRSPSMTQLWSPASSFSSSSPGSSSSSHSSLGSSQRRAQQSSLASSALRPATDQPILRARLASPDSGGARTLRSAASSEQRTLPGAGSPAVGLRSPAGGQAPPPPRRAASPAGRAAAGAAQPSRAAPPQRRPLSSAGGASSPSLGPRSPARGATPQPAQRSPGGQQRPLSSVVSRGAAGPRGAAAAAATAPASRQGARGAGTPAPRPGRAGLELPRIASAPAFQPALDPHTDIDL